MSTVHVTGAASLFGFEAVRHFHSLVWRPVAETTDICGFWSADGGRVPPPVL